MYATISQQNLVSLVARIKLQTHCRLPVVGMEPVQTRNREKSKCFETLQLSSFNYTLVREHYFSKFQGEVAPGLTGAHLTCV